MVEGKFNFYSIFIAYYKSVNKTDKTTLPLLYIYDFIKDFRPELYSYHFSDKILVNYFDIFYIISFNFILNSDLNLFKTVIYLKRKKLNSKFNLKKIFFLNKSKKYINKNIYLFNSQFNN